MHKSSINNLLRQRQVSFTNRRMMCKLQKKMGTTCHSSYLKTKKGFLPWEALSSANQSAIMFYTGLHFSNADYICHHHLREFGCDPKRKSGLCVVHKMQNKTVKGTLVTLPVYMTGLAEKHESVYPGVFICNRCRIKLKNAPSLAKTTQVSPKRFVDQHSEDDCFPNTTIDEDDEVPLTLFNTILESGNVDGLVKRNQNRKQLKSSAICKLKLLISRSVEILKQMGLEVTLNDIIPNQGLPDEQSATLVNIIDETTSAFVRTTDYREKIQLLTIFPSTISKQKITSMIIAKGGNCNRKMILKARKIRNAQGILAKPNKRRGHPLSGSVICLVGNYYNDDSCSYQMPGLRDVINVKVDGKKVALPKRILLDSLKELYSGFKAAYQNVKIGFSKFTSLRPKNCIMSTSKSIHNVCICQIHGDAHLLVDAIKKPKKYLHLLIDELVCDARDSSCMFGDCNTCIEQKSKRKKKFLSLIQKSLAEGGISDEVLFSQWVSKPRVTLQRQNLDTSDFCEHLYSVVVKLLPHHFISVTQSQYFKARRNPEYLQESTALIQLDFGENYSPIIQKATQNFHWENLQTTIHPFVVYVKLNGTVEVKSFVAISDELEHGVRSVYAFIHTLLQYLKLQFPQIDHVEYFSDGCGGQYKNYKMFANLMEHEKDFGVTATWSFFATSHGKGAVDGISAVLKHNARRFNLQNITSPILSATNLFDFATAKLSGIHPFFVNKEAIARIAKDKNLAERYASCCTIPGTRSAHKVVILNDSVQLYKTGLCKTPFNIKQSNIKSLNLSTTQTDEVSLYKVGDFVAALYDSNWYVGEVKDVDEETECCLLQFFKNPGTEKSFSWPSNVEKNTCWLRFSNILTRVTPIKISSRREIYNLPPAERSDVEALFLQLRNTRT